MKAFVLKFLFLAQKALSWYHIQPTIHLGEFWRWRENPIKQNNKIWELGENGASYLRMSPRWDFKIWMEYKIWMYGIKFCNVIPFTLLFPSRIVMFCFLHNTGTGIVTATTKSSSDSREKKYFRIRLRLRNLKELKA